MSLFRDETQWEDENNIVFPSLVQIILDKFETNYASPDQMKKS